MFSLSDYLPILLMLLVAGGFAVGNVLLSQFVGQRKATRTKTMPYECGKDPVGSARERFSVKFYLVAMIFILFDIELIFLMPWAVVFRKLTGEGLGTLVYVEMMIFVALLLVGYVYILKKGMFEWGERARAEAEAEGRALAKAEARQRRGRTAGSTGVPARAA
ncbi:MAG TPA: NADH-quinone oxidoreductase subunit A [Pyrinomonadaceae bacterium]|nr:NADH-quinone oxidoreductase subunit A [Pyrinomonadaceae bacterium]